MRFLALAWLLVGIAGCATPHAMRQRCERPDMDYAPTGRCGTPHNAVCEPLDAGFTPTRWLCWQDGPMAYRFGPAAGCADSQGSDAAHAERVPVPAPAAEIVPPAREDEVPRRPAKPAPQTE
jgi:hypothetical protein